MPDNTSIAQRSTLLQTVCKMWWLPLLRGILLIIFGAYALFNPGMTAEVLAMVVGIWLIAEGIVSIIAAVLGDAPSRLWTGLRGVLLVLVGLFVIGHSAFVAALAATTILFVIAFFAVLAGLLEIMVAIQDRKQIEGEGWMMLGGALLILFGILLFVAPLFFGIMIVRILGVFAIVNGFLLIGIALRIRGLGRTLSDQ